MWAETSAPAREIELLLADAPQEAPQAARAATAQAIDEAEELVGGPRGSFGFLLGGSGILWLGVWSSWLAHDGRHADCRRAPVVQCSVVACTTSGTCPTMWDNADPRAAPPRSWRTRRRSRRSCATSTLTRRTGSRSWPRRRRTRPTRAPCSASPAPSRRPSAGQAAHNCAPVDRHFNSVNTMVALDSAYRLLVPGGASA